MYDAEANDRTPVPVPDLGTLALAGYERIPFEDFPLPDRPAQLKPLDVAFGCFPDNSSTSSTPPAAAG